MQQSMFQRMNSYLLRTQLLLTALLIMNLTLKVYYSNNPIKKILGFPLGLQVYNLANLHPDSTFQKWEHNKPNREKRMNNIYSKKQVDKIASNYIGFNKWIQKIGQEPTIIDEKTLNKNIKYMNNYYSSFGWFNTEV